jgi:hypothetical protein
MGRLLIWLLPLAEVEAVRGHEIDERVAACLIPGVLDRRSHE